MKKYFLFLMCLLGTWSSFAQKGFILRVKLNNPQQYPITLHYSTNGVRVNDTIPSVENGVLVFRGAVQGPVIAFIAAFNNPALTLQTAKGLMPGPVLNFVLTNDEINVQGDVNSIFMAKVTGGRPNDEWSQIREEEGKIANETWLLKKSLIETKITNGDSSAFKAGLEKMDQLSQKTEALKKKFIEGNPNSFVSIYFLASMVSKLDFEDLKMKYAKLGDEHKATSYGQSIAKRIAGLEANAVGKVAVPFIKKDMNGNMVNLENLRGKYVLLDFWGSWCQPCRRGNPHLKELYAKYKGQGFEILGIARELNQSLEANRTAWMKAIEIDGINWLHVLNNEDINTFDVVKSYGVSAFPTKILLDKEGRIIGRFVGDDDLMDQKLKEIFGN